MNVHFTLRIALCVLASIPNVGFAQLAKPAAVYTPADVEQYQRRSKELASFQNESVHQRVLLGGKSFLGTPYVAQTLEAPLPAGSDEALVVNLQGLDCTTFVETTMALALPKTDTSFNAYCQ